MRFFADDDLDFAVRCVLNGVRYGMADVGEVLALCDRVDDGDAESWWVGWSALAASTAALGDRAAALGDRPTAWAAHLRAANYTFCAAFPLDRTAAPERAAPAWREHRRLVELALTEWPSPVAPLAVPWADDALPAWRFTSPVAGPDPAPLVVVVNGDGAPLSDVVMTGVADALERGWHAVAFDGPGQGAATRDRGLGATDDWGPVLAAVLTAAADNPRVAPDRLAVIGVSDGSFHVLQALAASADVRERVAATVVDPGVVRLDDGTALDPALLDDVPGPILVCDPEAGAYFPGQSAEVVAALGGRAERAAFTLAEGAGLDCEIPGPQVRAARICGWLLPHLEPPTEAGQD